MRFLKFLPLILVFASYAAAQNPAKWTLSTGDQNRQLKSGEKIKVDLKAEIEKGWHLYALEQPEGGPVATTIKVADGTPFQVGGKIESQKPISKVDPLFAGTDGKPLETKFFIDAATFGVPLTATADTNASRASVNVRFQLCNDTFCLPPKTVKVSFSGSEDVRKAGATTSTPDETKAPTQLNTQAPPTDLWSFIWLAITFGAISLLTPCVFPMIPITVSYFMKHSDGDRAKTIKLATV